MQRPTARLLQITFGGPETDLHPKTDMSKQDFAIAMASLRSGAPSSNPRIPPSSCNSQAGCATWTSRHVILFPNSVRQLVVLVKSVSVRLYLFGLRIIYKTIFHLPFFFFFLYFFLF